MGEQKSLFADIQPIEKAGLTLEQQFERFHQLNPHVAELLKKEAIRIKKVTGLSHCSIKLLFERLRWLYLIKTSGSKFKLDNNYHAYYARWLMENVDELEGFFRTRICRSRDKIVRPANPEDLS